MEHVKKGAALGTIIERRVLFQNQGTTVYDIWAINHIFHTNNVLAGNETMMAAISLREEDQRDDTGVGVATFLDMLVDPAFLFVFTLMADLDTNGAAVAIGNRWMPFPKPFTVPYAAWLVNGALDSSGRGGIEVLFERRRVSPAEKAAVVAQTGGKIQTS